MKSMASSTWSSYERAPANADQLNSNASAGKARVAWSAGLYERRRQAPGLGELRVAPRAEQAGRVHAPQPAK